MTCGIDSTKSGTKQQLVDTFLTINNIPDGKAITHANKHKKTES